MKVYFLLFGSLFFSAPALAQSTAGMPSGIQVKKTAVTSTPSSVSASSTNTSPANATPTPIRLELPLSAQGLTTSIEYAEDKVDEGLKPKVVILLDSSGSMAQLLDKQKSKMFYAKKLFTNYLQDQWREKADVGMIVYGSRRKHDCSDTYYAVPFGERNLTKIDNIVRGLSPTGMTPIARSLEMAIEGLRGYPGPKRVMIFTDGDETCGGDSCKILEKAIQDKVVDLEMFVTGIGMSEKSKDLDGLRCLGKTFGAKNPDQLAQALGDINNMINKSTGKNGGTIGDNLRVDCPDPKAEVKVYSLAGGQKTYLRSFIASYGVRLPPGEYAADVMLDPVYQFPHFVIPPKKKVILRVKGQGQLTVKFFDSLLEVEILDKHKKVVKNFLSDEPQVVDSGVFDIHVIGNPFFEFWQRAYKIIPAGKQEISIDGVGVVQVDYPSNIGIHVFNSADKAMGNYLTNFPFVLRAGSYRFFVNDDCNMEGISVRPEKTVQRLNCEAFRKK